MNILIISPGYHTVTGNHGGAIENLINIYLNHNENVKDNIVVYTVKTDTNEDKNGTYKYTNFRSIDKTKLKFKIEQKIVSFLYKLKFVKCQKNYYIKVAKDIIKRKEENKYDKIIIENGLDSIEYLKNKIKSKSKFVLHLHNDYLNKDTNNSFKNSKMLDEIWCVSDFIKNRVTEVTDNPNKVKTIYNCIDFDAFNANLNDKSKNNLKRELGIDNDDFLFIYVGRIMKEKGTLELIKSFNKLGPKTNKVKLLVVGGSKSLQKNSEYLNEVTEEAKDNKNVIFTGQLNNTELVKYYNIANVQIVPSIWNEAFGLIILEGIACNLPIIATKIGGIPEILQDNCIYVDASNIIEELTEKMNFCINNYNEVKKYTNAYKDIKNKFSKSNYNNTFYNLLHN